MTDQAASPDRGARPADLLKHLVIAAGTQSWLASLAIHLSLMVVLALVLGTIHVAEVMRGAAEFEAVEDATLAVTSIEPFELVEPPTYEPMMIDLEPTCPPNRSRPIHLGENLGESLAEIGEPGGDGLLDAPLGSLGIPADGLGPLMRSLAPTGLGGGTQFNPDITLSQPRQPTSPSEAPSATSSPSRPHSTGSPAIKTPTAAGAWSTRRAAKGASAPGPARHSRTQPPRRWACCRFWPPGKRTKAKGPTRNRQRRDQLAAQAPEAQRRPVGRRHQMYAHGLATIALCEAYGMTQGLARRHRGPGGDPLHRVGPEPPGKLALSARLATTATRRSSAGR